MAEFTFNILLAEDNDGDYELLASHLKDTSSDYVLHRVYDGEEVIPFLDKTSYPIHTIILDINMPLMNGHDVLKALKEDGGHSHIPVVVLTTSDYSKDIDQAKSEGAKGYIVKPGVFEVDELRDLVNKNDSETFLHLGHV